MPPALHRPPPPPPFPPPSKVQISYKKCIHWYIQWFITNIFSNYFLLKYQCTFFNGIPKYLKHLVFKKTSAESVIKHSLSPLTWPQNRDTLFQNFGCSRNHCHWLYWESCWMNLLPSILPLNQGLIWLMFTCNTKLNLHQKHYKYIQQTKLVHTNQNPCQYIASHYYKEVIAEFNSF